MTSTQYVTVLSVVYYVLTWLSRIVSWFRLQASPHPQVSLVSGDGRAGPAVSTLREISSYIRWSVRACAYSHRLLNIH